MPEPDVSRLTRSWSEITDVVTLSRSVVSAARQVARADGATFVLRDGDQCFYAMEDAMSPLWQGQRFPLTECISGWAMMHSETAIVPDIELDERIPVEAYRPTFVRSLAMTPVGAPQPQAAIGVYWSQAAPPGGTAVAAVSELGQAAAAALARVGTDATRFAPQQR